MYYKNIKKFIFKNNITINIFNKNKKKSTLLPNTFFTYNYK